MAKTPVQLQDISDNSRASNNPYVDISSSISVPNTAIVGRSSIPNIAADLKTSMGVERIPVQQIYQLQTEFGASGEPVFAAVNDDKQQIRFVGTWTSPVDSSGQYASTITVNDYCEVTFYGTGLNMLMVPAASQDFRVTTDGGAEGSNLAVAYSTILNARNYSSNTLISLVSGLSLATHTVKIRNNAVAGLKPSGFEVLNAQSTLTVNSGIAYANGSKLSLASQQSPAYNSGFESGTLGTKGGHVVVYQKSDGTVGKAVTPTDATALYLTSASHTNEEIVRKHYFREFAASRTDDFSVAFGNSQTRSFTLDDGATTLVGSVINFYQPAIIGNTQEVIHTTGTGSYITFTFVGTGLDVTFVGSTGISDAHNVTVDGVNISTTFTIAALVNSTIKIVSGLSYGTHTVRFTRNAALNYGVSPIHFIVYQPKKPSLPSGAIELADYNIVGNYAANTAGTISPSQGVIRKFGNRENTYVGSWAIGLDAAASGFNDIFTSTATNYFEYTFFGTGIEHKGWIAAGAQNYTYSIDGVTNLTGAGYTTNLYNASTGLTLTGSTGVLSGTQAGNSSAVTASITGIPLGRHTLRVTFNSGTNGLRNDTVDVITPIYSAKSNLTYDQQNTLPVGSCSLSDNRRFSPTKDSGSLKKNVSQAFGVTSSPTTSSTTAVPMPDMSVSHTNTSGRIRISYSTAGLVHSVNGNNIDLQVYIDGVAYGAIKRVNMLTGSALSISDTMEANVSLGVHKVDLYWLGSATATATSTFRNLLVEEL
jgi:hypothetical protein